MDRTGVVLAVYWYVGRRFDARGHGDRVRTGIVIENMNLLSPDVQTRMERGRLRILNSPLRLAGQLYRILGMGYLLSVGGS